MIEFDYEKIMQPNTVVHCGTKEQVYNLRIWAHSKGLKWISDISYTNAFFAAYDVHKNFCHNFYEGRHGSLSYYKKENYTILTYNDVILKQGEKMDNKESIKIGNKEFEIVSAKAGCTFCSFYKYLPSITEECQARGIIMDLFDIDCLSQLIIFKQKPEWVQCTYENTNVGDVVREKRYNEKMTIRHFVDAKKESSRQQFVIVDEYPFFWDLSDLEKQI